MTSLKTENIGKTENLESINLFNLLKSNKIKELKEILINLDPIIDINLRDNYNEYLLSYAILYNNLDITKLLIEKGARIDITDIENRSILYTCIKYGYNDIIKYLVNINNDTIGVNILDIKDKNNRIPLHYSIQKKDLDVIDLLLEAGANPNFYDNTGYNALHQSIFIRNIEIVKLILKHIGSINSKTTSGETALHIAVNLKLTEIATLLIDNNINLDIQDYSHEFAAIHYVATTNQLELLTKILEKKCNINIQDVFGNTALHYSFIEENYIISTEILNNNNVNVNVNLWNLDGKLPLHIFLENYDERYEDLLEKLLEKTNLSIRDNNGNNCLFYIVNLNLWKKYKNILIKKKIDLYNVNKNNVMLIDIIKEKERDEFIDLVVDSYLYRLKIKPDLWNQEWENVCSREFDIDKSKIIKKSISNKETFDIECKKIIRKKILETLEKIKSGDKICSLTSYPMTKNKVCIKLTEGDNLNFCTFTGNTIDVLLGLLYLLEKHKSVCSTLSTDFVENNDIYEFYKSIGVLMNSRSEFLNFEIVWINYKLYITDKFFEKIKDCIKAGSKYVIIPLGIELKQGSHANYLIYDISNNILERFEPHGSTTPPGLNYNPELLDKILESRFKEVNDKIFYLRPKDYLPKVGFQLLDIYENKKKKIGDPGGFCALWAIWYVDMRLTYNMLTPQKLVKKLIKSIRIENISIKNMIRNYAIHIIKSRDEILDYANIDINNWLNDEYTNDQLDKIIEKIKEKIYLLGKKN
jgi:ankyrin repeat protein